MRYEFTVGRSCRVKTFLKEHDISKGLLAKIKFEGGHIWVNGEEQFATYPVHEGDVVAIEIPDEAPHETLKPIPFDLPKQNFPASIGWWSLFFTLTNSQKIILDFVLYNDLAIKVSFFFSYTEITISGI